MEELTQQQKLIQYIQSTLDIPDRIISDYIRLTTNEKGQLIRGFTIRFLDLMNFLQVSDHKTFIKRHLKSEQLDENIDYIIYENKERPNQIIKRNIYLNRECAVSLMQQSNTDVGRMIRQYFMKLEQLIYSFKDKQIQQMEEQIQKMQKSQRKYKDIKTDGKGGYIYILKKGKGKYKIGVTTDIKKRMSQSNTNQEFNEEIVQIWFHEKYDQLEDCVKACLQENQYKGEIYEIQLIQLKKIIVGCAKNFKKLYGYKLEELCEEDDCYE